MADIKISALPQASALNGSEQIPATQGTTPVKILASQLSTKVQSDIAVQTFTAVALTNPYTSSISPHRVGDIALNLTSLEIWQANSVTAALTSWNRISGGYYGGSVITDLNSPVASGYYTALGTALNAPDSTYSWFVNHVNSNTGNISAYQRAVAYSTTIIIYERTKIGSVWGAWSKIEYFTTAYKNQVDANTNDVAELKLGSGYYYISGWDSSLSPTPSVSKGNQAWARDISHSYLFDMTQNTGQAMHPIGELQRSNYLRYIDGTFAPTVGITEAMRASCDVALYLDAAHTNLYSAAGAFNAATFYNTYGMNQKLYDGSGNEVRILRPWETTSANYHIGTAFSEKVWVIDGIGNSGLYWQGLAQHDITWDGVKGVLLERTAISPCPSTTVGGKMRNFFFLYNVGDTNTASSAGQSGLCTIFSGINRTFPRVNDVSQISNMNFARANNSVSTNPYPVAEGGYHALNAAIIRREILFGTRYLHSPSLFGSGISSNDTCNSEATFLANGGFKYKVHTDSSWNYGTFGITPTMCYNNAGGTTNASIWLSNYYPKEQCMESQLAASFAKETGVSPNTDFSFYGATYQYRNVTGVLGLADGRMNVIVTKVLSQTISAFNSSGAATSYDVACCIRMSLVDGMNLSGDIFRYFGGGYEQVGTCVGAVQPHTGDIIDIYLQPDQRNWLNITDVTKNNLGIFDFEKTYTKIGTTTNLGDNYAKTRMPLSAWKTSNGGSLSTGQCYYAWDNDYWSIIINQRVRAAARFGGSASSGYCCARFLGAYLAVSAAVAVVGGSAQVLVN